jgi:hypothetical protein
MVIRSSNLFLYHAGLNERECIRQIAGGFEPNTVQSLGQDAVKVAKRLYRRTLIASVNVQRVDEGRQELLLKVCPSKFK